MFVPVHSDLARTMSRKTGQNDIVERVSPKFWSVVMKMPNASVAETPGLYSHFLGFNCNEGPTADPVVREAVANCFDAGEAVSSFIEPTGVRQHSPIPDRVADEWDLPLSTWKDLPRGKNVDRAKTLFERAGVSDWAPTVAVPGTKKSGDKLRETFAEAVVHGLSEAGFRRARVKKYPAEKFRKKTVSGVPGDYNMFVRACPATADPDSVLYPQFHENNEGTTNGVFYADEAAMNDLLAARRSTDRRERRRLYASAIGALLEDFVCLPAYTLRARSG
jgi:peptide/nickel transport system substrate-binding protein